MNNHLSYRIQRNEAGKYIAAYWGSLYVGCYYDEGYTDGTLGWNTCASSLEQEETEGHVKGEKKARALLQKKLNNFLRKATKKKPRTTQDYLLKKVPKRDRSYWGYYRY